MFAQKYLVDSIDEPSLMLSPDVTGAGLVDIILEKEFTQRKAMI